MNQFNFNLFVYPGLFVITFIIYIFKRRKIILSTYMLMIYTITSLSSIYYYYNTSKDYSHLELAPYLYLFILMYIGMYPILKFDERNIAKINTNGVGSFLVFLSVFYSLFVWEGTLENFFLAIKSSSISLNQIYDSSTSMDSGLSYIGKKINYITKISNDIIPFLFFYYLTQNNKNKYVIIGLGVGLFSSILNGYANAERVILVRQFLNMSVYYLLFKKYLSAKTNNYIKISSILFLSIFIIALALITTSRFGNLNSDSTISSWITLYTGEGPLRFNTEMWNLTDFTYGKFSFETFRDALGLETYSTYQLKLSSLESKTGLMLNVFYTYIGDWFVDFGPYGTILLSLFVYLVFSKLTKMRDGEIKIYNIFLIGVFMKIFMFGFTYYTFQVRFEQVILLTSLLFYFTLRILHVASSKNKYIQNAYTSNN